MRWVLVAALTACSFKPTASASATPDGETSDSPNAVTTDAPPDTSPGFVPACATNSNYTLRPGDTHLYRHLGNPQFDDAVETCQTDGAYLARLDDADEETYVREKYGEVWIGVSDQETEGTFRNIASNNATVFIAPATTVTYAHWFPNEPNDAGGHEDCVYISGENGTWNDTSCDDTNHGAVCECDPGLQGTAGSRMSRHGRREDVREPQVFHVHDRGDVDRRARCVRSDRRVPQWCRATTARTGSSRTAAS